MPVTHVEKDLDNLTLTVVADFPVPVRRLWDAYIDPRQIEKFWGPPGWPATFAQHDVRPGGRSTYWMTSPEGERHYGFWEFLDVKEELSFEIRDGFGDADGNPSPDMPDMRVVFFFESTAAGSQLVTTTYFHSLEQAEQLAEMGMEEGLKAAMGQIDDVVADLRSFATQRTTEAQVLSDTQIRVSRIVRGTVQQVWRAHHDADLMQRWMLGPDGWIMSECEVGEAVGDTYRYAWTQRDGSEGFALVGEVLATDPPHREVFTEALEGMDGPPTRNEMTLAAVEGGTLLTLVITYADAHMRDTVLGTGMVEGMEASYARMEAEVLA